MTEALVHLVAVLGLLVAPGLLPALALVGRGPLALAVAPLLTALGCAAAAILSVAVRIPFGVSLTLVIAYGWVGSFVWLLARRRREPVRHSVSWTQLLFLGSALVYPLMAVRRAPVDWDARAIWLLHADWFLVGGAEAASALGNPLFAATHPDYPPLAPATMAGIWSVLGRDYELGQLALALLIASATLAIGLALCTVMKELPRLITSVAAGAVVLGMYGMAGAYATNGYVDFLWASAFVAAAVCLLLGPLDRDAAILGAVCLAVAMATKNEGMVAGMALILVTVVVRGWRRSLALASAPVLLAAVWVVTRSALGAESDVASTGRFGDLLRLESSVLDRVGRTIAELWRWARWEILVAGLLTAVGVAVARRYRRERLVTGWAPLWVTSLMCLVTVGLAYVVSTHDLWWYLATSVDRTTLAPRMLLLTECAVWIVVLLSQRTGRRQDGVAADPSEPVAEDEDLKEPALDPSPLRQG